MKIRKDKVDTKSSEARRSRIFLKPFTFRRRLHLHHPEPISVPALTADKERCADPTMVPLEVQRRGNVTWHEKNNFIKKNILVPAILMKSCILLT